MAAHRGEMWLRQKDACCALPGTMYTIATAAACAAADEILPLSRLQVWQRCVCRVEGEEPYVCGRRGSISRVVHAQHHELHAGSAENRMYMKY